MASIIFDKAKIIVWKKCNFYNLGLKGINTVNEGYISILDWIKND